MLEGKIVANVLRNFKTKSLVPIDEIEIAFELVTRPKTDLKMQFTPR